jgi:hypothetical protein
MAAVITYASEINILSDARHGMISLRVIPEHVEIEAVVNDAVFSAIMIRNDHAGFFIYNWEA